MEVTVSEEGLRAADAGATATVGAAGWTAVPGVGRDDPAAARVVRGETTSLTGLAAPVEVRSREGGAPDRTVGPGDAPVRLPAGRYRLRAEGALPVTVRFDAAAEVRPDDGGVTVAFDGPTAVVVGFDHRTPTVRLPRTYAGVAAGLSWLSLAYETTGPERSAPAARRRPPGLAFREEGDDPGRVGAGGTTADVTVPAEIRGRRPDTGIELRLPPELPALFTAAPLATYLGASVSLTRPEPSVDGEGPPPALVVDGETRSFDPFPSFQRQVARLLRRTFLLDCLVRGEADPSVDPVQSDRLSRIGLDPGRLAEASLSDRVRAYLAAPFDRVSGDLPEWHLSMYVTPEADHVSTLPHLVRHLPFLFVPRAEPLKDRERLSRSLDDFYRAASREAPDVGPVKPLLGPGRIHGWLARGVPIDVFKTVPQAYEHGAAVESRRDDRLSVVAVLNDAGMVEEYADLGGEASDHLGAPVDLTVRKHLSTADLARTIEADTDLLHYVGHCDQSGLRCTDGHLDAASVGSVDAEAFFLNACGSYHEGMELVRRGAVAGAVTFNPVLDAHAARVGSTFVRLLTRGFSLERAMDLARRRIIMGKDYAVVGDGTHTLTDAGDRPPADATLERTEGDGYRFTWRVHDARRFGEFHGTPGLAGGRHRLSGNDETRVLDAEAVRAVLRTADVPVVYDGDIRWSDELAGTLTE
jgi:hypothetical protein